ncbi:hypothetical protein FRC11_000698 [Ceratobasidium sp. 423]|nr:hypothetical protein FRC11_000698 [Ceratobasidium sp. 423]
MAGNNKKKEPKPRAKKKSQPKAVGGGKDLRDYNGLMTRDRKPLGESVEVQNPEVWKTALNGLDQVTVEGRTADEE